MPVGGLRQFKRTYCTNFTNFIALQRLFSLAKRIRANAHFFFIVINVSFFLTYVQFVTVARIFWRWFGYAACTVIVWFEICCCYSRRSSRCFFRPFSDSTFMSTFFLLSLLSCLFGLLVKKKKKNQKSQ